MNELRELADSELIDRIMYIDRAMYKEASFISDTLGSVGDAVQKYVLDKVDTSSPGNAAGGVLDILAPSLFFSIHSLKAFIFCGSIPLC